MSSFWIEVGELAGLLAVAWASGYFAWRCRKLFVWAERRLNDQGDWLAELDRKSRLAREGYVLFYAKQRSLETAEGEVWTELSWAERFDPNNPTMVRAVNQSPIMLEAVQVIGNFAIDAVQVGRLHVVPLSSWTWPSGDKWPVPKASQRVEVGSSITVYLRKVGEPCPT